MTKFDTEYIEKRLCLPVYAHGAIDSTSSEARRILNNGTCAPFLVIASEQSAGRGRQGKSFLSPDGGIYMSLAIPAPTENILSLTTRVCVALIRVILNRLSIDAEIKWVNDIWYKEKKAAGILTEAVADADGNTKAIIIGIGINTDKGVIPTEISDIAAALPTAGYAHGEIIADITEEIMKITADMSDPSYIEEYRRHSLVLGREISFTQNGITKTGTAKKINADGSLTVISNGEEIILDSGEITVRPI